MPTMITSKRLGYGVRILYELATKPTGYHSAREIADGYHVPEAFVRKILLDLRRAGVVTAQKGRTGGYRLARSPQEIKLDQVIKALEPETPVLVYGKVRGGGYPMNEGCPTVPFWRQLEACFIQELAGSTLADVVGLAKKPGEAGKPGARKGRGKR